MKLHVTFICSLLFCLTTFSQENLFYKGSQIAYYKVDSDFVAIMQRPVTNREYIIYLQWMRGVFSPNYPQLFYNSVPGLNMDSLKRKMGDRYGVTENINLIIDSSEPFVKDYMFNPKYLDYPAIGISWQNANNYGKWLADRYNENKLIKTEFLMFNPVPTEQDYFSTDTYIAGLWQGGMKRYLKTNNEEQPERLFEWSDDIFIPAFRLATKSEIIQSNTGINEFKPYPFSKKHFLYRWYKEYFGTESDTLLELWRSKSIYLTPEKITCNNTIAIKITGELILDINNKNNTNNLSEIFNQNQQSQVEVTDKNKEEFMNNYFDLIEAKGPFPYIIIAEDKAKKPIYVTNYKNIEPANTKEFKVFRLACSAIPEQLAIKSR
jgi:hypothetical protein